MLLSIIKISPAPGRQQEILDILQSVRGPTLAVAGCRECSIYAEHDEEQCILYLEIWQGAGEMIQHIRTALYSRVLKAMELSAREPEISFHEVSGTQGIELIEKARSLSAGIPH
jgi:quinol monooxygenase YgiN